MRVSAQSCALTRTMVGKKILHYQLIDKLGAGGMGEIYKGQDSRLNRLVAVKILSPGMSTDAERRRRFFQEAQAASALNHPNIITLYDIVSENDLQCIVMEYIAGKTLRDLIPPRGLPATQAIQYATQIASALTAAHTENIIHRDLKPSNIMVTTSGLVKVLDFGLAKWVDAGIAGQTGEQSTLETALTREGSILGTVSYMSPEQAEGKRVDGRSDIFSFGSVLYEMVTGKRAFEGRSGISTLSAILRDDVKPIYEAAPDVPPMLEQIVLRCLLKDPAARWQSMKEIEGALIALQRQLDPDGRYSWIGPSGQRPLAATPPVLPSELPAAYSKAAPAIVAPASVPAVESAPPPGRSVPPNGPPQSKPPIANPYATGAANGPPKTPMASSIPPSGPRPPAVPSSAPTRTTRKFPTPSLVLISLIGVLLLAAAGVAGWYWWKSHQSPRVAFTETAPTVIPPPVTPPEPVQSTPPAESSPAAPPQPDTGVAKPKRIPKPKPEKAVKTFPPLPVPAPVAPIPAPTAIPIPPPPKPAPKPVIQTTPVMVSDALPFEINLAEDVPADAPEGLGVRFIVTSGLQVGDKTVIAKGATVMGTVTGETGKKKFLGIGSGRKLTFRLTQADAVDGRKLAVRAMAGKSDDGPTVRSFETTKSGSKTKGYAAMEGAVYIAYIDGDQIVAVRK